MSKPDLDPFDSDKSGQAELTLRQAQGTEADSRQPIAKRPEFRISINE